MVPTPKTATITSPKTIDTSTHHTANDNRRRTKPAKQSTKQEKSLQLTLCCSLRRQECSTRNTKHSFLPPFSSWVGTLSPCLPYTDLHEDHDQCQKSYLIAQHHLLHSSSSLSSSAMLPIGTVEQVIRFDSTSFPAV